MTKPTLAFGTDKAGYLVFKLGAAGVAIGLGVGVATGGHASGWPALETWIAYSSAVAVAGALVGSLAGIAGSKARPAKKSVAEIAPQAVPVSVAKATSRPKVSAFRALPKDVRRVAEAAH